MAKKEEKPQSFEAALKRLEAIVDEMESGETELDAMIASFEEGQRLVAFCSAKLNEVEKRIEKIVKDGAGGTAVEPFELSSEDSSN
ncbi:MAG TPA: exodeoxyribonuclease VII small subunit [Kiritimatiellia bacterium]|jgi:exodeoxyribonuclease VII small subunit|nr:exodeoxyribonuclease VII small subunit [Kiritimatiellia bacterium]HPC49765.1 exodeoxyribonuclease VII small subunit [Kiritimatiellia bacterium]HPK38064.1 exodeoxyribonuclease VII small subunit [Kiritimatiellia bacterium]HPW76190.1 exodeoxyribonuclease VII small subunit [Kiritimatiellia bacterium]